MTRSRISEEFILFKNDPDLRIGSGSSLEVENTNGNQALEYDVGNHCELLEGLAAKWTDSDPAAASKWALAQPDGEWRDRLVAAVGLKMFDRDPNAATQFILDEIPAGKDQDNAILSLVVRFSSSDFDEAMTWVKSFPPGPLQSQAIAYLQGVSNSQQN